MCKECNNQKNEPIIVAIDLGMEGDEIIKVWGISFEELNKELHTYNKLYQDKKYCGYYQDYLEEKGIKFEEFKPPVINISDDEY